jgi:transposase
MGVGVAEAIDNVDPGCEVRRQQGDDDVGAVLDGVMYILSTGCRWAAVPKNLPPRSTVNDCLRRWDEDRTLDRIHTRSTCCAGSRPAARPARQP